MSKLKSLSLQRIAYILVIVALLVYGMSATRTLLLPLAWAAFLALLLLPVVKWLQRHRWPAGLAIGTVMLAATLLLAALLYFLSTQMIGLVSDVPQLGEKLGNYLHKVREWADQTMGIPYAQQPDQLRDRLGGMGEQVLGLAGNALNTTARLASVIGLLPIYMFLLLLYREHFKQFLVKLTGGSSSLEAVAKATNVVRQYLQGLVMVTSITCVLACTLFFSLGVEYAFFFGLFVAIFNIIPYIGVVISGTVSVLYVFLTSKGLTDPLITLGCLWVIQLIEANVTTPYIVGNRIRLNALAVLIALVTGGLLWGVSGLILFIPLLGALKVVFDEIPILKPWGYLLGDPKDEAKRNKKKEKK